MVVMCIALARPNLGHGDQVLLTSSICDDEHETAPKVLEKISIVDRIGSEVTNLSPPQSMARRAKGVSSALVGNAVDGTDTPSYERRTICTHSQLRARTGRLYVYRVHATKSATSALARQHIEGEVMYRIAAQAPGDGCAAETSRNEQDNAPDTASPPRDTLGWEEECTRLAVHRFKQKRCPEGSGHERGRLTWSAILHEDGREAGGGGK
ncbi:hypothetical protein C8F04DRAFT_1182015 [Mycena alexandri]|uniref:Uncharacterized protein n=1 Tax=Mycena alexandri TaxID=1745969 RepID=A0AAD6T1Q7_9AGAR|nr:hypothetical protein C8F04DRAFT_1182015 [Mycena alexandri]